MRPICSIPAASCPNAALIFRATAILPFGAGPRVCIGQSFSMQEAILILARVMRAVDIALVEGPEVAPLHRVTLRPDGPVRMRLERRSH